MWKEHEIIMLPTTQNSNIFKSSKDRLIYHPNADYPYYEDDTELNQHLYILSNDILEDNDWCIKFGTIYKNGCEIHKFTVVDKLFPDITFKKIIATTDTSIILHENIENVPPIIKHGRYGNGPESQYKIPQIPESFIKEYCEKGGVDKILVEYEQYEKSWNGTYPNELKVSSDNTIIIQLVEDR